MKKLTSLPGSMKMRQELTSLRATIARYSEQAAIATERQADIADLQENLKAAKAEEDEAAGPLREEMSVLVDRITEGERILSAVTAYEGARAGAGGGGADRERLAAEHAELETLVEALGPNGIRTSATGGVEELQGELNGYLGQLGLSVDLLPFIKGSDDLLVNGRAARLLSSSEAIRFGVAFQCAVASWSGVGVVCVDDFDRFDQESGAAVQALLGQSGHQVLIFSTIRGAVEQFRERAEAAAEAGS